jgi:hypothetical protein
MIDSVESARQMSEIATPSFSSFSLLFGTTLGLCGYNLTRGYGRGRVYILRLRVQSYTYEYTGTTGVPALLQVLLIANEQYKGFQR